MHVSLKVFKRNSVAALLNWSVLTFSSTTRTQWLQSSAVQLHGCCLLFLPRKEISMCRNLLSSLWFKISILFLWVSGGMSCLMADMLCPCTSCGQMCCCRFCDLGVWSYVWRRKGVWRRARGTRTTGQDSCNLNTELRWKSCWLFFPPCEVNAEIVIISVVLVQTLNEDLLWFEPKWGMQVFSVKVLDLWL